MAEWKASITRSRRSCAKLMGCVTSVTSCSNSIAFITPDRNFSDEPFFEDLSSERAIAARCADSMSIRAFLKYELNEKTPEHSSFTVIRQRLGLEIYERIFTLTLQALDRKSTRLNSSHLGI